MPLNPEHKGRPDLTYMGCAPMFLSVDPPWVVGFIVEGDTFIFYLSPLLCGVFTLVVFQDHLLWDVNLIWVT